MKRVVVDLPMPPVSDRRIWRRVGGRVYATARFMTWRRACEPALVGVPRGSKSITVRAHFGRPRPVQFPQSPVAALLEWVEALVLAEGIARPGADLSIEGSHGEPAGSLSVELFIHDARARKAA